MAWLWLARDTCLDCFIYIDMHLYPASWGAIPQPEGGESVKWVSLTPLSMLIGCVWVLIRFPNVYFHPVQDICRLFWEFLEFFGNNREIEMRQDKGCPPCRFYSETEILRYYIIALDLPGVLENKWIPRPLTRKKVKILKTFCNLTTSFDNENCQSFYSFLNFLLHYTDQNYT